MSKPPSLVAVGEPRDPAVGDHEELLYLRPTCHAATTSTRSSSPAPAGTGELARAAGRPRRPAPRAKRFATVRIESRSARGRRSGSRNPSGIRWPQAGERRLGVPPARERELHPGAPVALCGMTRAAERLAHDQVAALSPQQRARLLLGCLPREPPPRSETRRTAPPWRRRVSLDFFENAVGPNSSPSVERLAGRPPPGAASSAGSGGGQPSGPSTIAVRATGAHRLRHRGGVERGELTLFSSASLSTGSPSKLAHRLIGEPAAPATSGSWRARACPAPVAVELLLGRAVLREVRAPSARASSSTAGACSSPGSPSPR